MTKGKIISSLSVFFPAYNEEDNIKITVAKAKEVLNDIAERWEIIVVNDGSSDDTAKVVETISSKEPNIRLISHEKNRGYGASLKSGLYSAKYPWIAFTDSDGQFDFSEITNFIQKQRQTSADIVIGYYKKRKVSLFTILTSKLWELLVSILFGLKVKDIDCGFKLISKKVIEALPKLESERGAFISSEILIKAKKKGFNIVELGVNHYPRKAGKPTGRDIKVIIKSFADLYNLWKKLR